MEKLAYLFIAVVTIDVAVVGKDNPAVGGAQEIPPRTFAPTTLPTLVITRDSSLQVNSSLN